MKKNIHIHIMGGLGNQLFQFAAARNLALTNDANLIMQKIEDFIVQPNKTTDILENINTIISKKKVVVENEIIDILNSELGEIQ